MRQVVFRTLAGILAALSIVAIIFGGLTFRQRLQVVTGAVLFGAFALFGYRGADVVMSAFFGVPGPPSDRPD